MRLTGRKDDQQPALETVGMVVITYNQGRNGPNRIAAVRQADFGRLVNVINAYQEIVRLRGELRTHPNEQVRRDMREALGLPHPRPKPLETRPFELQTYTVQPGRRRRPATLTAGAVVTLSPWLMRSAQLTEIRSVAAPVEK